MSESSGGTPSSDDNEELRASMHELRLQVDALRTEVHFLRSELAARAGMRVPPPAAGSRAPVLPQAPRQTVAPSLADADRRRSGVPDRRGTSDVESLIGRYGTLLLGALLLVMGAGVLVSWAVQHIQFRPVARVVLGLVGGAILAGIGMRLRARGSRPFGNTLLGISLALVHVDAWGAGPSLHVISNLTALMMAALASAALAFLAWRTKEQALFVFGVGGAFLAPFVTADKRGDVVMLLVYGWVVLTLALWGLRGRSWTVAARVLTVAASLCVLAAASGDWGGASRTMRDAPTAFAILCALTALVIGPLPLWPSLMRTYVWVGVGALIIRSFRPEHSGDVILLAASGTFVVYLAQLRQGATRSQWLVTALGAPLAFLAVAVATPEWGFTLAHAGLAAAWSAAALVAASDSRELRDAHLFVGALASGYAVVAASESVPVGADMRMTLDAVLLALHAGIFGAFARRTREPLRLLAPALGLAFATALAFDRLSARPAYAYAPFFTLASLAMACVVAGWMVVTLHARQMLPVERAETMQPPAMFTFGAAAVAFLWGREELSRSFTPDIAIFLVILYSAAAGVTAILAGRRWQSSGARRAGLAIAVYAALKAVYQTSDLENAGLRIGAYVLVGSFLLGVAFLYRAAGESSADDEQSGDAAAETAMSQA